jgi:hypothetical protein
VTMHPSALRATFALISIGLLVGACARAGTSNSTNASPEASVAVTSEAPPGTSLEPAASTGPPAAVRPSTAPAGGPSQTEPPAASIAVDGGDPVEGQLGSFTWLGAGSDAPWLDGSPIHVGAGERLTLTLADPLGMANWTASRVAPGNRDGNRAVGMGEGSGEPVAFEAPPHGSWSVNVNVWFSDNRGSAAYYWLVDVD